jgi:hypothetical protein
MKESIQDELRDAIKDANSLINKAEEDDIVLLHSKELVDKINSDPKFQRIGIRAKLIINEE